MMTRRTAKSLLLLSIGIFVIGCASPSVRKTSSPAVDAPEQRESEPEREREEVPPERWLENEGPYLSAEDVRRVMVRMPVDEVLTMGTEDSTEESPSEGDEPHAHALFEGEVHRYSNERGNGTGLGRFVELRHETRIELGDTVEHTEFFTIYAGLSSTSVRPRTTTSPGDPVGTADTNEGSVLIAVYTRSHDPVWRKQTARSHISVDGYYFWDPSFVLSPP
ncbi:MAG: hypothetical protein ACQETQ_08660 [Spirochaetota bacterium]